MEIFSHLEIVKIELMHVAVNFNTLFGKVVPQSFFKFIFLFLIFRKDVLWLKEVVLCL